MIEHPLSAAVSAYSLLQRDLDQDARLEYMTLFSKALTKCLNEYIDSQPTLVHIEELPLPWDAENTTPNAKPTVVAGADDYDRGQFEKLFQTVGVPVVDGLSRWFRDIGGWDKAQPIDRRNIYEKAKEFYAHKVATQPAVANMNICPKCKSESKLVPAGVSKKTGKPYKAFYSCSDRVCNTTWRDESEWATKAA